jgi:hypothetical protein
MRQITDDEYDSLEASGPLIAHWLENEMTVRERKVYNALSRQEKDVAKIEYLEKKAAEREEKQQAYLKEHPLKTPWSAPDTLTSRIEGSMNDADAIVAALREHWSVDK